MFDPYNDNVKRHADGIVAKLARHKVVAGIIAGVLVAALLGALFT